MSQWLANNWRTLVLSALVVAGLSVLIWQPVSPQWLLATGERLATRPGVVLLIIAGMMLLFALALPGSLCFWLLAPFHPPVVATTLLTLGSLGGAWGGYLLAGRLGGGSVQGGPLGDLLRRRSDFLTQCALRIFPGFPHSVINYVAGALGLPLLPFLLAALFGLAVKWAVYSSAVHSLRLALETGEMAGWETLWPLGGLAGFLLAGAWLRHRLTGSSS